MDYLSSIEIASIDSSTFTGNLQAINTAGLPNSCSIIRIINNSDRDVTVSYDGSTNHDFLPDGETLQINLGQNTVPSGYRTLLRKGTVVYVSGLAGGTGLVYLVGYYS